MADGVKISEFIEIEELQTGCCFPTISDGKNRKITYAALKNQLINELKAAGVTGMVDITNLVTWASYITNQSLLAAVDKNLNIVTLYAAFTVGNTGSSTKNHINILSGLPYKPRDTNVNAPVWWVIGDETGISLDKFTVYTDGKINMTEDDYSVDWHGNFYSAISYFKAEE